MSLLNTEDFRPLSDLNLTSKDGKAIIPAFTSFFSSFQEKLNNMFSEMKEEFLATLAQKDIKIENLEGEIGVMKGRIERLENQLDDNEAYERRDTVIISGPKIPPAHNDEKCDEIVCKLVSDELRCKISPSDVSTAHRLGPKRISQQPDTRSIIVKFCRRDVKSDLISSAKRVKPSELFFNESLTPQRQTIFHALRSAKKQLPNIIDGCSTREGSVYVWVKPPRPSASPTGPRNVRVIVNTMTKLQDFCEKTLNCPVARFLRNRT